MSVVLNWILRTVAGRWVTGLLVTALLGGVYYKWYTFKEDLREEGTQVCVQEINKETMLQLQDALAAEKSARAELTVKLAAAAVVNQTARDRRRSLEDQLMMAYQAMDEQARTDDEYKAWGDTPLPAGVAPRVQDAAGSNTSPVRDDPN